MRNNELRRTGISKMHLELTETMMNVAIMHGNHIKQAQGYTGFTWINGTEYQTLSRIHRNNDYQTFRRLANTEQ